MNDHSTAANALPCMHFWSIVYAIYGLLLAALVAAFLPWKTPALNAGLIAFAALHLTASPGLWRGRNWGWNLAVFCSFLGFLIALLLTTALVSSWAYLRGIFGDFGNGASIGALLFASVAIEIFGLFPALALRSLIRIKGRCKTAKTLVCTLFGLCSLPFLFGFGISQVYGLSSPQALDAHQKALAIRYVRAAVNQTELPQTGELSRIGMEQGPLFISFWDKGNLVSRTEGNGPHFESALTDAVRKIDASLLRDHPDARIKIDRISAHGPIFEGIAPLLPLSVNPGIDGLHPKAPGSPYLLPDDLIKMNRFGAAPLIPSIRELRLGLDFSSVFQRIGTQRESLERIRSEGFIEFEGRALDAVRGNTPLENEGPEAWKQAAIEGGDFILRQLMPDGRFFYQYFPLTNTHSTPDLDFYSLPRHSGTIYALALIYGQTQSDRFKQGAKKAIDWLAHVIPENCGSPQRSCVMRNERAELGGTALTMVGMLEYQRQTGDPQYEGTLHRLAQFLLDMQKENGDFYHFHYLATNTPDRQKRLMFYSEEAALALVMASKILKEDRYLKAAERALDFLTTQKYSEFFLGKVIYGADHWTCIAAEEAWPSLQSPKYLEFCQGYADFIGRLQYEKGEWQNADFEGHYGFGAIMVPQAPAAAGFTEAIISTTALAAHQNQPTDALYAQVSAALNALARDQIRKENAWLMPNPEEARGGIRRSLVEQEVRIDFTQHAASALIRGAKLAAELQHP